MSEDSVLIEQFKGGSADALHCIYRKYENRLLALATALLIDVGEAEDAVHDVFVRFAESIGRVRVDGSLRSYLATCVANRARDMIRRRRRRSTVPLDQVAEPAAGRAASPHEAVIRDEQSRRLHRMLAGIPYEQREVIMLHVYEDLTFREIAAYQGTSINTVQGRYRYALEKLRSQMADEVSHESR